MTGNTYYRFEKTGSTATDVRVQYDNGTGPVMEDYFDPELVGDVYKNYIVSIYGGENGTDGVIAGVDEKHYQILTGEGVLTVRAVEEDQATAVKPVQTSPTTAAEGSAVAVAPADTVYTLNDTGVVLPSGHSVSLLFDEIITSDSIDRMTPLQEKIDEFLNGADENRRYEIKYLDLVDANNGNAWVKSSKGVDIYWGYPEGTDSSTQFTLLHFSGLHRDGAQSGFDVDDIDAVTPENVTITNTGYGIRFHVEEGGFSPFALVWSEAQEPSPEPDPGEDDNGDDPPLRPSRPNRDDEPEELNTEDHVAYLIGFTDGTIRPEADISRAEVATIFFRLLTDEARETYWSQTNAFSDVDTGDWYNNAVSTLANMGILDGYLDGTFRPTAPISRSEFTKIAVSFFDCTAGEYSYEGWFSDVQGGEWFVGYLTAAMRFGLIEGMPDGTFRPLDNITRAEACTIVNRTLGREPHEDYLLSERRMNTWPDNSASAWYYAAMQEATNSHDYAWVVINENKDDEMEVEEWTDKLDERDWAELERTWSDAYDAPGGEVMD